MTDKVDAVRAVVEAARAWHHADPRWCQPVEDALDAAVFDLEAAFTARYEELPNTMWRDVRPGDLVLTPRGKEIAVLDSYWQGDVQCVKLSLGSDQTKEFEYPLEKKVNVRRPIDEMNRAIDLFVDRFDISFIDPDQVTS
jgi:hypothetical protein